MTGKGLMLALFLLGVAGVMVMLVSTRWGAGLNADSLMYINTSRNLLNGRGFSRLSGVSGTKPVTHFPPLFPLLLAGLQMLGVKTVDGALLMNALAFGSSVLMVGLILNTATGKSWPSLIGSALMLASPILIEVNSWAKTEPLYIMWGLIQVFLLVGYARSRQRFLLVASAVSTAFAYLTRYVGISLIVPAVLAILLEAEEPPRRRLENASIFLGISLAPTMAWMIRNILVSGSATNRRLVWHPVDLSHLKLSFALLWKWLLPFPWNRDALLITICVLLVVLGTTIFIFWRRGRRSLAEKLKSISWLDVRGLLVLYVLSYSGVLLISLSLLDAWTPLDERITSPLYVSLLVLLVGAVSEWWSTFRTWILRLALALSMALLLVSYVQRSVGLVSQLRLGAQGYASNRLGAAGDLEVIRSLPTDILIYSNSLPPLEFFYRRGGLMIPLPGDPVTTLPVHDYQDRLVEMRRIIQEGSGVMILFFAEPDGSRIPSELSLGLERWHQEDGVTIYVGEGFERTLDNKP
jgi:hypothetical protein